MVTIYHFYSQFSELRLLWCPHVIPPLCSPTDALCCSAGRTTAPTRRADAISWFDTGLPHPPPAHCQTLWKLLEASATFSCSRQTCPAKLFGQKTNSIGPSFNMDRQFQLSHESLRATTVLVSSPSPARSGTDLC